MPNSHPCQSSACLVSEQFLALPLLCIMDRHFSYCFDFGCSKALCPTRSTGGMLEGRGREKPGCFPPSSPAPSDITAVILSQPQPNLPWSQLRQGHPCHGPGCWPLAPPPPPMCPSPGVEQLSAPVNSSISHLINILYSVFSTENTTCGFFFPIWTLTEYTIFRRIHYTAIQRSTQQKQ